MVNNWLNNILSILYPPGCLLCGDHGVDGLDLCSGCRQSLPRNVYHCPSCALPLPSDAAVAGNCGRCRKHPPPYSALHAPYLYQPPLDNLISGFKYQQKLVNGRTLGQLLAQSISRKNVTLPEVLLPLPMHGKRLRNRGFNQASELARHLSLELDIPWQSNLLLRSRWTEPQQGLNQKQRLENVRNSFRFSSSRSFKHVALVDDVVTTGATVNTASQALKNAGIERIDVWAVARTPG